MSSLILRRSMIGAFSIAAAMTCGDAFASCGDIGRPCDYDRIEVFGSYYNNNWSTDYGDLCFGWDCDYAWYENPNDDFSGSPPPPGTNPEDVPDRDGLCVHMEISDLPMEYGGGYTELQICFGDQEAYDIIGCMDYPWFGDSACPDLMP